MPQVPALDPSEIEALYSNQNVRWIQTRAGLIPAVYDSEVGWQAVGYPVGGGKYSLIHWKGMPREIKRQFEPEYQVIQEGGRYRVVKVREGINPPRIPISNFRPIGPGGAVDPITAQVFLEQAIYQPQQFRTFMTELLGRENLAANVINPKSALGQSVFNQIGARIMKEIDVAGLAGLPGQAADNIAADAYERLIQIMRETRQGIVQSNIASLGVFRERLLGLASQVEAGQVPLEAGIGEANRILRELAQLGRIEEMARAVPASARATPVDFARWARSEGFLITRTTAYQELMGLSRALSEIEESLQEELSITRIEINRSAPEKGIIAETEARELARRRGDELFEYHMRTRGQLISDELASQAMEQSRARSPISAQPAQFLRLAHAEAALKGELVGEEGGMKVIRLTERGAPVLTDAQMERILRAQEEGATVFLPRSGIPYHIRAINRENSTALLQANLINPANIRLFPDIEARVVTQGIRASEQISRGIEIPDIVERYVRGRAGVEIQLPDQIRVASRESFLSALREYIDLDEYFASVLGYSGTGARLRIPEQAFEILARHAPWALATSDREALEEAAQNMALALVEHLQEGRVRLSDTGQPILDQSDIVRRFIRFQLGRPGDEIANARIHSARIAARELIQLHRQTFGREPKAVDFLRAVEGVRRAIESFSSIQPARGEDVTYSLARLGHMRALLDLSPEQQTQLFEEELRNIGQSLLVWDPQIMQQTFTEQEGTFLGIGARNWESLSPAEQREWIESQTPSRTLIDEAGEIVGELPRDIVDETLSEVASDTGRFQELRAQLAGASPSKARRLIRQQVARLERELGSRGAAIVSLADEIGLGYLQQAYSSEELVEMGLGALSKAQLSTQDIVDVFQVMESFGRRSLRAEIEIGGIPYTGVIQRMSGGDLIIRTSVGTFGLAQTTPETIEVPLETLTSARINFPLAFGEEVTAKVWGQTEAPFLKDLGWDVEDLLRRSPSRTAPIPMDPGITLQNLQALLGGAPGLVVDIETTNLPGREPFGITSIGYQPVRFEGGRLQMGDVTSIRVALTDEVRQAIETLAQRSDLTPDDLQVLANVAKFANAEWGRGVRDLTEEAVGRLREDALRALQQFTPEGGAVPLREALKQFAGAVEGRIFIGQNVGFDLPILREAMEQVYFGRGGVIARSIAARASRVFARDEEARLIIEPLISRLRDEGYTREAVARFVVGMHQLHKSGAIADEIAKTFRVPIPSFLFVQPAIEMEQLARPFVPQGSRSLQAQMAYIFGMESPEVQEYLATQHQEASDVLATSRLLSRYAEEMASRPAPEPIRAGEYALAVQSVGPGAIERGAYEIREIGRHKDYYRMILAPLAGGDEVELVGRTHQELQYKISRHFQIVSNEEAARAFQEAIQAEDVARAYNRATASAAAWRFYRHRYQGEGIPEFALRDQAQALLDAISGTDGQPPTRLLEEQPLTPGERLLLANAKRLTPERLQAAYRRNTAPLTPRQQLWNEALASIMASGYEEQARYPFLRTIETLQAAGAIGSQDARHLTRRFNEALKTMAPRRTYPYLRLVGTIQQGDQVIPIRVNTMTTRMAARSLYAARAALWDLPEFAELDWPERVARANEQILSALRASGAITQAETIQEAASQLVQNQDALPLAEVEDLSRGIFADLTEEEALARVQEARRIGRDILREYFAEPERRITSPVTAQALREMRQARQELGDMAGIYYFTPMGQPMIRPNILGDILPVGDEEAFQAGLFQTPAEIRSRIDELTAQIESLRERQADLRSRRLFDEASSLQSDIDPLVEQRRTMLRTLERWAQPTLTPEQVAQGDPLALEARKALGWWDNPPEEALITRGAFSGRTLGDVLDQGAPDFQDRVARLRRNVANEWANSSRIAPLRERAAYLLETIEASQAAQAAAQDSAQQAAASAAREAAREQAARAGAQAASASAFHGGSSVRGAARVLNESIGSMRFQYAKQAAREAIRPYLPIVGGIAAGLFAIRQVTRRDLLMPDRERAKDRPQPALPPVIEQQTVAQTNPSGLKIHVQATADQADPSTVAGLVKQSIDRALGYPVQVNVHVQDDRKSLTQEWVDQTVAQLLQGGYIS